MGFFSWGAEDKFFNSSKTFFNTELKSILHVIEDYVTQNI